MDDKQVFRSPTAVVVWWVWVLFAVGNLIDLAVQGKDHESVVAAFVLLLITGVVYVTAFRPRVTVGADALTVINPVRDHRIGWAAVAGVDSVELLRIRCEWPGGSGTDGSAKRAVYAWAVHSARRKQLAAEVKARRRTARARSGGGGGGLGGLFGMGGFGRPINDGLSDPARAGDSRRGRQRGWDRRSAGYAAPEAPVSASSDQVITALTERAGQARADELAAQAPTSTWDRAAVAAVLAPALALLIVVLV